MVLTVLFAVGHFAGFLAARDAARSDPGLLDLTKAMQAHTTRVMGMEPSILDFREYFSANFSLLLLAAAGLTWVGAGLARKTPDPVSGLRTLAAFNIVAFGLLAVSSGVFRVPQGIVSSVVIIAAYAAALRPTLAH